MLFKVRWYLVVVENLLIPAVSRGRHGTFKIEYADYRIGRDERFLPSMMIKYIHCFPPLPSPSADIYIFIAKTIIFLSLKRP